MNMCAAADVDTVVAMYGYHRAGAHCMRYVEFVPNPTAGSWALSASSVFLRWNDHWNNHVSFGVFAVSDTGR